MQRAERWALMAARPLAGIGKLVRPIVLLLSWSTNLIVRLLGGDPDQQREDVTEDELRELVATQTVLRPDQQSIISGAFEISDRPLREIFVPRRDVTTLDARMSASDGLKALAEQGHSRAPVIEADDLDSVIGVAHMRDLIGDGTVRDAARPAPLIPETVRVLDALNVLRAEREQMAIVIDEHGGAEGMVTVEDLLEEIVGEIYDETDVNVISARRLPDGSYILPGTFPVHDLVDLGVDLPGGDYATVAGLMLDRLGKIPDRVGESVVVEGWQLTVRALHGRAIERVAVRHVAD
jgi:putative hemolysin